MIGFTVEIGTNLLAVVAPVAGAAVIVVQNRFANKQLKSNGGTSLRDAVDRMEAVQKLHVASTLAVQVAQADQTTQIADVKEQVTVIHGRLDRLERPADTTPYAIPVTIVQTEPTPALKGTP